MTDTPMTQDRPFFYGLPEYVVTPNALAETEVRLFPESKHRSKRIRKKLLKRFGGEFKKEPAAFKIGNRIIIHPALYERLKQQIPERRPNDPR